jgi:hypothetical protein
VSHRKIIYVPSPNTDFQPRNVNGSSLEKIVELHFKYQLTAIFMICNGA